MSAPALLSGPQRCEDTARRLLAVRRGAPLLPALPPELVPISLEEAYAVQHIVLRELGTRVAGWKATLFDAGSGICAPLSSAALLTSPARLTPGTTPTRGTQRPGLEPEIAFSMAEDLPPRADGSPYSAAQVYAAVAGAHAAIEVVVSRFAAGDAVSRLEQVADQYMHEALILGPVTVGWSHLPLEQLPLQVQVDGRTVHEALGGHPVGSPLLPLVWLANHLTGQGQGLRRGDVVTTGSCNGVRYLVPGQSLQASFGGLGTARLDFAADRATSSPQQPR